MTSSCYLDDDERPSILIEGQAHGGATRNAARPALALMSDQIDLNQGGLRRGKHQLSRLPAVCMRAQD